MITSPSFPLNYTDSSDCVYSILQPTGNVILLNILSMDIEYNDDPDYYDDDCYDDCHQHQYGGVACNYDYLEIRDGASEHSPLIDGYCGDGTILSFPIRINISQNNAWLR